MNAKERGWMAKRRINETDTRMITNCYEWALSGRGWPTKRGI